MRHARSATLAATLTLFAAGAACSQARDGEHRSQEHRFRTVTVADGLEHPWGLAFLPGGGLLVTERPGRLRIVRDGRLDPRPIDGVPEVWTDGQGGLLDVALHPDFERNRLVYLTYSKPGPRGATTAVSRGRLGEGRLEGVEEILEADAWSRRGVHFGSRLAWDRDGFLYVTVGDRGTMADAQDLGTHAGKILRLHDDGRVPADNPFVGRAGARPEIFAYGIRSPQGLAVHPVTGALWESEQGPQGGDEINLIRAGRNYGWPTITYGINYDGTPITGITEKEGMEQPLHYWVPSIATSGTAVYHGDAFPRWRGDVLVGGLAGEHLARVSFDGTRRTGSEKLLEGVGRVRDVRVGPDGLIYLLLDDSRAPILRLEPADGPAAADADDVVALTGATLWDGTGAPPVPDAVVLIREGRVTAAGPRARVEVPAEARRVELEGRWIVPGLVNAHGHAGSTRGMRSGPEVYTRDNLLDQLGRYARYGVTTVVSLGDDGPEGVRLRDEQGAAPGRARLFVAGPVIAPTTPVEAAAEVERVAAMGADWVKIRVDDALDTRPKMPPEVFGAVMREAEARDLPVAVHVVDLDDAKDVVRAGADLLAHSVRDAPVDAELIALMRERGVCLSPTLTRELSTFVYRSRPNFFDDPFFLREADPAVMAALQEPERQRAAAASESARWFERQLPVARANLKALSDAGVGIAFGTDSGPAGRFQGYFEHLELEMMAEAGLSPERVLLAATRDAARCTGLDAELGTLEPGRWADLLVVGEDPLRDVRALRSLESVWVGGTPLPAR